MTIVLSLSNERPKPSVACMSEAQATIAHLANEHKVIGVNVLLKLFGKIKYNITERAVWRVFNIILNQLCCKSSFRISRMKYSLRAY